MRKARTEKSFLQPGADVIDAEYVDLMTAILRCLLLRSKIGICRNMDVSPN